MNFKIQLIVDDDQGQITTEDIIQFERDDNSAVGLSLIESKALLKALQRSIILCQAQEFSNSQRHCLCAKKRLIKGYTTIHYRTLFGIIAIPSIRLYHLALWNNGFQNMLALNCNTSRQNGHH